MTDVAWLAGFFDGEGSIELAIARNTKGGQIRVQLRCEIANTHQESIDHVRGLLDVYKIDSYKGMRDRSKYNSKIAYRLIIAGYHNTTAFIRLLLPYLVTKKEHAELALSYVSTHKYMGPISSEDLAIANRLRLINSRGLRKQEVYA